MLYLNNDYCYSLEDLRAVTKQCAIIGPELDNPLIIELLCALKDGSLKSFLEGGTLEEQTIANQLPDYTISKDDVELLNLLHQCFDNSYEMKKVSLSDYLELVSVRGKIGDGETKELRHNEAIGIGEGITSIEFTTEFKVKKTVNLTLDFYLQYEYLDDIHKSSVLVRNLMDAEDIITISLPIEVTATNPSDKVNLNLIVGNSILGEEHVWNIDVVRDHWVIPIKDDLSITMIYIEGGSFNMGSDDGYSDERPVHRVTLSDFYIGETVVTQELWIAIMGSNPSRFIRANKPVEQVSWDDCQIFITKLNELTGKKFRLPTEAEWEYAARGGNKSKGYKYAGSNRLDNVAWYDGNSSYKTHPVKQKQANELGLYDMSGNVWELCYDWFNNYSKTGQTNPIGSTIGFGRVARGGSCGHNAFYCRTSCRGDDGNYDPIGIRLVLGCNSLKAFKRAEETKLDFTYLKIIDFGEKAAQVKYKISHRTNLDIYKANSLSYNDVVQIHQNDAINLKNELEALGATVQIVDK